MTAAPAKPKAKPSLTAYGYTFTDSPEVRALLANELLRELFFFREASNIPTYEGPGAYAHAKRAADMLWNGNPQKPGIIWHPDCETALEEFCKIGAKGEVLVSGSASGGKSFAAAIYSVLFWLCDQSNSAVLVCSTTLPGLRKRIWGEVRRLYLAIETICAPANYVESKLSIESVKGDAKHGIFGVSVGAGDEAKALGRLIGFHVPRMCVIADELTDVPEAIVQAMTNLSTGKKKAAFIGLGNAASYFDSHGKMCEPEDGWASINVNTDRWKTKRGGVALHFDGFQSPNVLANRVIYPFLLTREDIAATARDYGENSPQMWRFRRGFWPPDGIEQTVLSESLLQRFAAMSKEPWADMDTQLWAGLDPAFGGGDKCLLSFAKTGKTARETNVVEFAETVTIKTDLTNPSPLHFQIANSVKEHCVKRGVNPRNFGMDVTGEGGGLASIIAETWSPDFHQVEFGGKPSEMPVSEMNPKTCREEYDRKVTELWYSFRVAVMAGQVRGLSPDAAKEFCIRLFSVENKIKLEKKTDMKLRVGRSPDAADSCCVLLDTIRSRGALGGTQSKIRRTLDKNWQALVQEFSINTEDSYLEDSMAALL
jgi:hypothetical protein